MADWRADMGALLDAHESEWLRYACLISGNIAVAPRLVGTAVAACFSGRSPAVTDRDVRHAIAVAYLKDVRAAERRRSLRNLLFANAALDAPPITTTAAVDPVFQALRRLSPRTRTCVVLTYVDTLSVAEIGHLVSLPAARVRGMLTDGVGRLEATLGPFEDAHLEAIMVETRR